LLSKNLKKLFKKDDETVEAEEAVEVDLDQKRKDLLQFKWSNYSYKLLHEWKLDNFDASEQTREESKEFDMSAYSQYI
jgi:hypothetical protein